MLFRKIKILFVFVLMSLSLVAQELNDINYIFTQSDSSYTFYGSFRVDSNAECLLAISFEYKHVKALNREATEVILIDSGNNWNKISFTYQTLGLLKNESIWFRVLDKENKTVEFNLLSSINNSSLMPEITSSSGFFKLRSEEEYYIMEYYQECVLTEKMLTKLYINQAQKEAIKFMHKLSGYAKTICNNSTSINKN